MTTPINYPELSEAGQKEAEQAILCFVNSLKKAADEALDKFYCNLLPHIETDAWTNFRNDIINGLRGYEEHERQYCFREMRAKILEEHREAIIADINADLLEENTRLKEQVEHLQTSFRSVRY